jgi:hypothetical protein
MQPSSRIPAPGVKTCKLSAEHEAIYPSVEESGAETGRAGRPSKPR